MDIQINDIQKKEKQDVRLSIRTSKKISKWMKENEISPTALFNKSALKLMKQNQKKK